MPRSFDEHRRHGSMPDTLFELLFRYPRVAYDAGELVWGAPWPPLLVVSGMGAGALLVLGSYLRSNTHGLPWGLVGVRVAGLIVLGLCLLRPTLVVSTAVPQQNVVAVLLDDSRSMEIADAGGSSRGSVVRDLFVSEESRILDELGARFLLRHYRFSAVAQRLIDPSELAFQGTRTRLGHALDQVRRETASLPLSGLVLVSDGGDQEPAELQDALLALRAEGIPVHVVGVGRAHLEPDVEIERVEVPTSVVRGATVIAEVVVAHRGMGGRRVPVQILENGRILASEVVELPGRGGSAAVQIPLTLEGSGVRRLRVTVPPQPGELVGENNHRDVHVRVRSEPERILYFEGEPRHEVGFLRRALRDDDGIRLVVLQRTGDDRYLRLDVDDADELADGFPRSREELFGYRGLVLGSVEASFFTPDQLRMIAEFVDRRGGGLLVLGGWSALAEGGYAGTALGPVIPVELEGRPPLSPEARVVEVQVEATERGLLHPVGRLGARSGEGEEGEGDSLRGWASLPPLTSVNRIGGPRAGATVVLEGRASLPGGDQPVLAYQRYGAGVSAILGVQDTWLWQMHADVPLEDRTHELFWRQLLRWLVQESPDPVQLTAERDRVAPDEPVRLVARVRDASYLDVNDARITAIVTDPFGAEREIPLSWSVERDGEYRGSFVPDAPGPHEVRTRVDDGGASGGGVSTEGALSPPLHIEAGVLDRELGSGAMRTELLRRVAEETGGRFYTPDRVGSLPEAIGYTERGTVVQEERELWDLPAVFFLLVGLLSVEWLLRRRRGLA